jgi:hypothetical protein
VTLASGYRELGVGLLSIAARMVQNYVAPWMLAAHARDTIHRRTGAGLQATSKSGLPMMAQSHKMAQGRSKLAQGRSDQ